MTIETSSTSMTDREMVLHLCKKLKLKLSRNMFEGNALESDQYSVFEHHNVILGHGTPGLSRKGGNVQFIFDADGNVVEHCIGGV